MQADWWHQHLSIGGRTRPSKPPPRTEGTETYRSYPSDVEILKGFFWLDELLDEKQKVGPIEQPYVNAFKLVPKDLQGMFRVMYASQSYLHLLTKEPVGGRIQRCTLAGIVTNKVSPNEPNPEGDNIFNFVVYSNIILLLTRKGKVFIARKTREVTAWGIPAYEMRELTETDLDFKRQCGICTKNYIHFNDENTLDDEQPKKSPLAIGEKFTTGKGVWVVDHRMFYLTNEGISCVMLDQLDQHSRLEIQPVEVDGPVEDFFADETRIAYVTHHGKVGQIGPDLKLISLQTLETPSGTEWKWNSLCPLPWCQFRKGYFFKGGLLACGFSEGHNSFWIFEDAPSEGKWSFSRPKTEGKSEPIHYMRSQMKSNYLFVVASEAQLDIHLFGIYYDHQVPKMLHLHTIRRPENSDRYRSTDPSKNIYSLEKIGQDFYVGGGTWILQLRIRLILI